MKVRAQNTGDRIKSWSVISTRQSMKLSFSSILFLFSFFLSFFFFLLLSRYFHSTHIHREQNCCKLLLSSRFENALRECVYLYTYVCACVCVTRVSQYPRGRRRSFFVEGIFQLEASMRFIASRKTRCKKGGSLMKRSFIWKFKEKGGYMDVDLGFF